MDLIFKRYSNPYMLLNEMILYGKFSKFIDFIVEKETNDTLFKIYLSNNPYNELSFVDWKDKMLEKDDKKENSKSIESTVKCSLNILKGFKPT